MRKAPEAFRTISEVAEILRTPAHVLRFWESKFSQVKPVKRAGGRRYYRPSDLALLGGIRALLHDQGMTIRGVQKLLSEKGVRHVAGLAPENLRAEPEGDVLEQDAGADDVDTAPAPAEPPGEDPPRHKASARAVGVADAEATTGDAAPDLMAETAPDSPGTAPDGDAESPGQPARDTTPEAQPEGPAAPAAATRDPAPTAPGSDSPRDPGPGEAAQGGTGDGERAETPTPETETERLAARLRRISDAPDPDRRAALAAVARRVDALLERMSKAGGAERW